MSTKRKVEIFGAGCAPCDETVATVQRVASSSCEVEVLDMHDAAVAAKARAYGACSVPAVSIDGALADCCAGTGHDEANLRAAGIGTHLP
jgi:glutaredoxin 3